MEKTIEKICVISSLVLSLCACGNIESGKGESVVGSSVEVERDSVLSPCYITTWKGGMDKAVVFTWDDMSVESEQVAEIFDEFNLPATFFINTAGLDKIKNRIKHPLLISMYNDFLEHGHEIGTHTRSHVNLAKVSLDEAAEEMKGASDDILKHFGYRPATMSYPTSHYNAQLDSIMRLSYLDSRYTVSHDSDSLVRYIHVRSDYDFAYYKKNIDAFVGSNAELYVYGGHQLDGQGYEPMSSNTLKLLLTYIISKYDNDLWVATFGDAILYRMMRERVLVKNSPGQIHLDISKVKKILDRYSHINAYLTLCFPNANLDISGGGNFL